jgi:hypothetical protein
VSREGREEAESERGWVGLGLTRPNQAGPGFLARIAQLPRGPEPK